MRSGLVSIPALAAIPARSLASELTDELADGRCHSHAGTGVVFDLFTLGALIAASLQFQTDSGAFMSAVKEIAGTSGGNTGLNVVDKAAQARSTLKVLGALSSISKLLQVRAAPGVLDWPLSSCRGSFHFTLCFSAFGASVC